MLTSGGLRLGISLPQTFPGELDHGLIRDYIRRAEASGYEDLWLTESILSPNFYLEPVTYLSYVAALSERIRLGVSVIILNLRNPVQLAKELACLDQLSGGRLTVGVGLGGARNYAAFGVGQERRVARFVEAVKVMKALWTEERVSLRGDFWQLDDVRMEPKPLQRPHMPLWFGAQSAAALQRAVRLGDGWMAAGSASLEESLDQIRQVREYLAASGRDAAGFTLSKRIYLAVEDDERVARERLTEALAFQYGGSREFAARLGLAATPTGAVEVLGRLREAGLHHLLLNPCYDHGRQMELLIEKVTPQL